MKRMRGSLGSGWTVVERQGDALERERSPGFGDLFRFLIGIVSAALLLPAGARTAVADEGSAAAAPGASVELDRLLRLPDSYGTDQSERRGGATRLEWLQRFEESRAAIREAEAKLDRAERELDEMAGGSSSWNVAPPGTANPQSGPLSFRLREEIRRQREAKETAEKALRALIVKADLVGVPADWREPQGSPGPE